MPQIRIGKEDRRDIEPFLSYEQIRDELVRRGEKPVSLQRLQQIVARAEKKISLQLKLIGITADEF